MKTTTSLKNAIRSAFLMTTYHATIVVDGTVIKLPPIRARSYREACMEAELVADDFGYVLEVSEA